MLPFAIVIVILLILICYFIKCCLCRRKYSRKQHLNFTGVVIDKGHRFLLIHSQDFKHIRDCSKDDITINIDNKEYTINTRYHITTEVPDTMLLEPVVMPDTILNNQITIHYCRND